ncbi:MAG: GreA/GreB family elongation factor [Chitinophagaceae bacterium]|nr:MAG: GreA/GreB family elongation factor [Chitinophagaceae bacterium]
MENNEKNPVIVTQEDYELLKPYISGSSDDSNGMSLSYELKRAVVVKDDAFPPHAIKLNSKISIVDLETQQVSEFTIVLPKLADMHTKKISVLSPMGTALIGFRKGEEVEWQVPAGLKRFRILDVINE